MQHYAITVMPVSASLNACMISSYQATNKNKKYIAKTQEYQELIVVDLQ